MKKSYGPIDTVYKWLKENEKELSF